MTTKHTVTMKRTTSDGALVQFWSDGAVTVGHEMNNRLVARGLGRELAVVIADEVCLYEANEIRSLIKGARKADSHRRPAHWIAGWTNNNELRRLTRVFAGQFCDRAAPVLAVSL